MSRDLGQLLGANEVPFRQQIARLEQAAGAPRADIRLGLQVVQATKQKILELGLDPADTTGHELYNMLQTKLRRDEVQVRASLHLRADIPVNEVLAEVAKKINALASQSELYVIKQTAVKQIIKKLKPKATMKKLGYRSMDSMLKHEAVPQLLAACMMSESAEWHKARLAAYGKLQTKDFELRRPQCIVPAGKRWPELAADYAETQKNNVIALREMGDIVVLPMARDLPGLAITTFVVSLHALNDLKSLSTYLKLHQVRPDFGEIVRQSVANDPLTEVELGGNALSWQMVHWFYAHGHADFHPEVFEPHVQPEDLDWHRVGVSLERLHPTLTFWQETEMLGLLDGADTVSLNVLDVALGVCNGLEYGERILHHMREALGRELFARYLHTETLQTMLAVSLGRRFSPEVDFTS